MTAQPVETVLRDDFLIPALETLDKNGFVTDEHAFTPYRETMSVHIEAIQGALEKRGFKGHLAYGYVDHHQAGYAYFIYDTTQFSHVDDVKREVSHWLTSLYGEDDA